MLKKLIGVLGTAVAGPLALPALALLGANNPEAVEQALQAPVPEALTLSGDTWIDAVAIAIYVLGIVQNYLKKKRRAKPPQN